MLSARGGSGRVTGEVVERLVMELEDLVRAIRICRIRRRIWIRANARGGAIGPSRCTDVAIGIRPPTGVPGPADAGRAQLIADRLAVLRRQLGSALERLVGRLDGVDRVVAARASRNSGWADLGHLLVRHRTGGRVERIGGLWHAVRIDDRMDRGGSSGPGRRRGRDQPLVVEERSAERALEEVVSDRVVRMILLVEVLVDRKRLRVVVALRQAGGVAARRVAILLAVVELILLLIEAVDDVCRAAARQIRRAVL